MLEHEGLTMGSGDKMGFGGSGDKSVNLTVETLTYTTLSPAVDMIQQLTASLFEGKAMNTGATEYMAINGACDCGTEGWAKQIMTHAGTFQNAEISIDTAPSAGKSWTFTMRKNNADQAITITIADAATTGEDRTHTFTVVAGDVVNWKIVPSGTPDVANAVRLSVEFKRS